jgi:hypothetical protein
MKHPVVAIAPVAAIAPASLALFAGLLSLENIKPKIPNIAATTSMMSSSCIILFPLQNWGQNAFRRKAVGDH